MWNPWLQLIRAGFMQDLPFTVNVTQEPEATNEEVFIIDEVPPAQRYQVAFA
jgi:hypothetical protein